VFSKRKRISERASHNMIVAMAKHGNHNKDLHDHLKSVKNIKDHFKQNDMNFSHEVSRCREFSKSVPMYENLIGAQWTAQGVTVSKPDHITGEYKPVVSGDGVYNENDYWANFDIAREDFEAAISTGRYERFLSAINAGLASIEGFLNHEYMRRKRVSADDPELKKDLEWKVSQWVSQFTGHKFDKSGKNWADFKYLKELRNEGFQHRKSTSSGVTFAQFAKELNMFKNGICHILLDLHVLFSVRCTTWIIRYAYFPEIIYQRDPDHA